MRLRGVRASVMALVALATVPARGSSDESRGEGASREGADRVLGAELELDGRFLWRGVALSKGAVAQPSLWGSWQGFTTSAWANVVLNEESSRGRVSAFVPSLTYENEVFGLMVEPGIFVFANPLGGGTATTAEARLAASYPLGSFRIAGDANVDVLAHGGAYYGTLGLEYERSSKSSTLKALLDAGFATMPFNQAYFHVASNSLDVVELKVVATFPIGDYAYVTTHAEPSVLLVPNPSRRPQERIRINGGVGVGVWL